ncbi:MAG: site-specific integrase, partial [Alphaproteobacteria bacterium]
EQAYRFKSRTSKTRRAYMTDMEHFTSWCSANGFTAVPAAPLTVQYYLAAFGDQTPGSGGLAISTLGRRLVAISHTHKLARYESPTTDMSVREVLRGIRREAAQQGYGKPHQATPLLTRDIKKIVTVLDKDLDRLIAKRDKALLLMEWSGAFRSGEMGTITYDNVLDTDEGLIITLPISKTDQVGVGVQIGIRPGANPATCPVTAYRDWISAAGIRSGAVLREVNRHSQVGVAGITARNINRIVRKLVMLIGLDPEKYSGHSCRAGIATQSVMSGVPQGVIMAHGRWKSERVFRRYVRLSEALQNSPVLAVGL